MKGTGSVRHAFNSTSLQSSASGCREDILLKFRTSVVISYRPRSTASVQYASYLNVLRLGLGKIESLSDLIPHRVLAENWVPLIMTSWQCECCCKLPFLRPQRKLCQFYSTLRITGHFLDHCIALHYQCCLLILDFDFTDTSYPLSAYIFCYTFHMLSEAFHSGK